MSNVDIMKKEKKLFILGYTGYYNLGDDLMVDLLTEKYFQELELLVLSRRKYYKKKINYISRYNLIRYFFLIKKGDLLLNLGGIFQDKTSILSFFYYFIMNLIFLIKKGKIVFLNTEFRDVQYSNKFVSFLLKHSRLAVLRSEKEYEKYCKDFKNIYYCPDIVFIYQFEKLKRSKKDTPYILVSLRDYPKINQLIKEIRAREERFKFLLMNNEIKLKTQIMKYFPENDIYIYNYFNKHKIFNLIFNADEIITMRFHVGILGLLFNKKTEIIGLNNKIKILNEDFGLNYINNNRKKNIDKLNKNRYINKDKIEKLWEDFFNKITNILEYKNSD